MKNTPDPIYSQFNISADVRLEKRLQSYDLTSKEREAIDKLRLVTNKLEREEIASFRNKEEFESRLGEKIQELQKFNKPSPELHPKGGPRRTLSQHQILLKADTEVRNDHRAKIQGFHTDRDNAISGILKRVNNDGRGPKQEQDKNQQQDRSLNQEFNRHM